MALIPGDVVTTGTPPGVGMRLPRYLQGGDTMRAGIERLGLQQQRVAAS